MRAFVFTDPSLERLAGQFVWLEIDVEKAQNAAIKKKLVAQALPSFYVLDPATERVAIRWVGGASVRQLHKVLGEARVKLAAGSRSPLDSMLAAADALYGEGKNAEAVEAYQAVLANAPADWPEYGRALEALMFGLQSTGQYPRCVDQAGAALDRMRGTPTALTLAVYGVDCAMSLPDTAAGRRERIEWFEAQARAILADSSLDVSADDRSSVLATIMSAREALGDSAGHQRAAEEWAAFLERAAAAAGSPEAATVFDGHRLSAYLELRQPERAEAYLAAHEKAMPGDYNPPARLAVAYLEMKRYEDAVAAADRALAKAYGPRKLRIFNTRADALARKGDAAEARKTLEQAIAYAEALPQEQRSASLEASLKKKLQGLP